PVPSAAADPDDCADEHAASAIARATTPPNTIAFLADPALVIIDTSPPVANSGAVVVASHLLYNL
ncbi:MAG: hypothetical protein WAK44_25530, partial [Trebonia sp.]